MSATSFDIPPDLRKEMENLGIQGELSISEWIADAVRQKLAAAKQLQYLQQRAARGNLKEIRRVLASVPAVDPGDDDRWPAQLGQ